MNKSLKSVKSKLLVIIIVSLTLFVASCKNEDTVQPEGKVFVSGRIMNFEKHKDVRNINFFIDDFYVYQRIQQVEITDDGSFQTTIPCHFIRDFHFRYSRASAMIICEPFDSIYLTIDATVLDDSVKHYLNDSNYLSVEIKGKAEGSSLANEFISRQGILEFDDKVEMALNSTPREYLEFWTEIDQIRNTILDSMLLENNVEVFRIWAKDYLKFLYLDELIKYANRTCEYSLAYPDSMEIPEAYFPDIFDNGFDHETVFSHRHFRFIQSYYVFLYKTANKDGIEISEYIQNKSTGFLRDILLSKFFYGMETSEDNFISYNSKLIESGYVKNQLAKEVSILKNNNKEKAEKFRESQIMDTLFAEYKGKVVYVDFWAPWCKPCMAEMPHSKGIQEYYKGKDVVFLFLGCNCKEESWQNTIIEERLGGEHILLTNDQYRILSDYLGIFGIPHYAIINRDGEIVMKRATRPSKEEKLVAEIDKLLI